MQRFIPIIIIIFIFSSCNSNSKNRLAIFRSLEKSLEQSNETILNSSKVMNMSLVERLNDPRTQEYAKIWQPKAQKISELASQEIEYIENLKAGIIHEAGYRLVNKSSVFEDANYGAVYKIFIQNYKGDELYKRLRNFIDGINDVDEMLKMKFGDFVKKNMIIWIQARVNKTIFLNFFSIKSLLLRHYPR